MLTEARPDGPTYIPIREAAARLGVNKETLRRWDRAGVISAVRTPGNARRFLLADVENILKGNEE